MSYLARRVRWWATAMVSLLVAVGPGLPQVRGQSSYAPVDIKETFASIMARMTRAKPEIEKRQADLLNERYDLGNRPAQGVTMSRGKPVQEGVRAKLPAGHDLGTPGRDESRRDPGHERVPQGILSAAASQPSRGRHALPALRDRGDQEAGGARPDPLRSRLRSARSFPARVSRAHLPDHAPRPRRRIPGQAGDHRQLLRAVQRHPQSQAAGGAPVAGDALSRSSSSTRPRIAVPSARAGAWPASIATPTATRTPPRIWSATFARRSSDTASIRRRCAG